MSNEVKRKAIKISLLGDQNVGKTCICGAFLNLEFIDDTLCTIGKDKMDSSMKMEDGKEMKLVIWDTAGQERFHSIALSSIKNAQGIIVVFDVTLRKSFNNVVKWLKEINDRTDTVSIVLFGNKCDMEKREVTKEEAEIFAKQNNLIYFETSAKNKININEGFQRVANDAYKKYGKKTGIDLEDDVPINVEEKVGCCGGKKRKKENQKTNNK